MEAKYLRYCTVASFLASVAFVTGMVAEKNRKPGDSPDCDYSKIALGFGIVSFLFTIIARIYMSAVFRGSAGCCRKFIYFQSWYEVCTVAAAFQVLAGMILSHTQSVSSSSDNVEGAVKAKCKHVPSGLFASGASFALASAVFGIAAFKKSIAAQDPMTIDPEIAIPVGSKVDPEKNTRDQSSKV